jgi:hypothetical protein
VNPVGLLFWARSFDAGCSSDRAKIFFAVVSMLGTDAESLQIPADEGAGPFPFQQRFLFLD